MTRSLLLTCLVPVGLLALRYYYSRKVILAYLDCALHTDMADIEQYYMRPPGAWRLPLFLSPPFDLSLGRAAFWALTVLPCWIWGHGERRGERTSQEQNLGQRSWS